MDFQQLLSMLQAERDTLRQLIHCLEREHQALAELDGPGLEALAGDKRQLLLQLEKMSSERGRLLSAAGHDPDAMETLIDALDRQGRLSACWRQLLEDLHACQHQNRVNGGIIELGRERLQLTLGLLRGQDGGMHATLYQANGRTPTHLDHRALGTA